MYKTMHAIVYMNKDGTYGISDYLCHNQWCAVDNIPKTETRPVVCIAQVPVYDVKNNDPVITVAELREMWEEEIATEKAKWLKAQTSS